MRHKFAKLFAVVVVWMGMLLFPQLLYAHSVLVSAVPGEQPATEPVTEITLSFNTKIEKLSKVTVTDEAGATIPLQDTRVESDTLTGVFEQPLENGAYSADWRIIGADGHAIKGSYSFTVDAPEAAEAVSSPSLSPEASAEPEASQGSPAAAAASEPAASESAAVETGEPAAVSAAGEPAANPPTEVAAGADNSLPSGQKAQSDWLPWALFLVVLSAAAFLLFRKRKAK